MAPRRQVLAPDGYRLAFHQVGVGLAVLDLDGAVLEVNQRLRTLLGPQARRSVATAAAARLSSGAAALGESFLVGRGVRAHLQPLLPDDDRALPGYLLVALPIGLGDDQLTGLGGRGALMDRLSAVLGTREGAGATLIVLDLDDFKRVNDEYGHVVGDEVLVEVAARLVASHRPEDGAYRWGGDEFVVVLDSCADHTAAVVGRRLEQVLRPCVRTSAGDLSIGASWGAVHAREADTAVELLHRADQRMYELKRARKNMSTAVAEGARPGEQVRPDRRRRGLPPVRSAAVG